ncbi:MAG: helix-turn-helix domain-containing protein [Catonella sp.]|nr:helix-turn-helix domain-containing protein [Catonella sp.]MDY6355720.1 helix-turn-helix domain-containing protein [Catonella sp.]
MRFVKEIRLDSGMTQKDFAERFGIPLSTLRKWEQGEAKPAPYFVKLLDKSIPGNSDNRIKIASGNSIVYYFDKERKIFSDSKGTDIPLDVNISGVNEKNLGLYLNDLFEGYYKITEKFKRDCELDVKENITWIDWE